MDGNCDDTCPDWEDRVEIIDGWSLLWQTNVNIETLKTLVEEQPVACYMEIFGDFMSYKSGIYEYVSGGLRGGHFVVIVGWNDAEDYWICKNSWGTDWGEDGYFRIKRGETEIGTYAMVADYTSTSVTPTPKPTTTPTPVLELGVTLEMPGSQFTSGDAFYLDAKLCNPGMPMSNVPLVVLLEVAGSFWSWPSWSPISEGLDWQAVDVHLGTRTIHIIESFEWPDIE